jgi:Ni/Fe-hydrogenase 1 B-type cytochrome subunit
MSTQVQAFRPVDAKGRPHRYFRRKYVWQWPIRIFHWVNAVCVTGLFFTGLYISWPILAPAGEPWNNFVMGTIGFPFIWRVNWWRDLTRQLGDYLKLERGHVHLGHNALGGLMYTLFVIALGWFQIFTGFAMFAETNPGGFWDFWVGWTIPLLGGSFAVHMWHHMASWLFLFFSILHIYIVFYDGQIYKNGLVTSMISGVKFFEEDDVE